MSWRSQAWFEGMRADNGKTHSDFYAPYGTCRKCGWTGKDWGFNYHGYCKKCHSQWRKEKAEERRRLKPPNVNVELAEGVIVTRNVRERLKRHADRDVAPTTKSQLAGRWGDISSRISKIAIGVFILLLLILEDVRCDLGYGRYLFFVMMMSVVLGILGLLVNCICNGIKEDERSRQMPEIDAHLVQLARERQRRIDETNAFYASSEWRLIREQVIQEQGRMCQRCRRHISNDNDLTVDHIKPRSKFPELALDKSNLQILCRTCNSAKGATCDEESIVAEVIESTSKM